MIMLYYILSHEDVYEYSDFWNFEYVFIPNSVLLPK